MICRAINSIQATDTCTRWTLIPLRKWQTTLLSVDESSYRNHHVCVQHLQQPTATDKALQHILLTIPPIEITLNPKGFDIFSSEVFLTRFSWAIFDLPEFIVIDSSTDKRSY